MTRNIFKTIEAHPTTRIGRHSSGTIEQVVSRAVIQAERDNKRLRTVGSAWSSSDVFVSDEVLLEGKELNSAIQVFGQPLPTGARASQPLPHSSAFWLSNALHPRHCQRRFAYIGPQVTVLELYQTLDRYGLTLMAMGGASGQTVIGAISTGTHGGDITGRPIADSVHALKLVGPGGAIHWIESSEDTALTRTGLVERHARTQGLDVKVHQNDEIFNAALTSVGCMGVIIAAVVEVVQQFGLNERVVDSTWQSVSSRMRNNQFLTSGTKVIDMEIFLNPYSHHPVARSEGELDFLSGNPRQLPRDQISNSLVRDVALVTRYRTREYSPGIFPRPSPSLLLQIRAAASAVAGPISEVTRLISELMRSTRGRTTSPYRSSFLRDTYSGPNPDGSNQLPPGVTSEICITTANNQHLELIRELLEVFDRYISTGNWFSGFFSIRFQKASRALLSMQYDSDPTTYICHIEVQALITVNEALADLSAHPPTSHSGDMQGKNDEFMRRFEEVARRRGARMHWGQLNLLTRATVEATYSETLYRWRKIRTLLSKDGNSRTFSNDFSERVGLESYTEVVTMCSSGPRQYDLFGYREDGALTHLRWDGQNWAQHESIENPFANLEPADQRFIGPLTSAGYEDGRVRLFASGLNNHLLTYERSTGTASDLNADSVVFPFNSPISACVVPGNPIITLLFGLDIQGNIICATEENGEWRVESIMSQISGHRCYGRVVATCAGSDRIDIFARAIDGRILHAWKTGGRWRAHSNPVIPLPWPDRLTIASPIACSNRGPGRLDILGLTALGSLVRIRNNGSGWRTFLHPPLGSLETSRRRSTLALVEPIEALRQPVNKDAPHYQPVEAGLPNSFWGELTAVGEATSSPITDRLHVIGLGRTATSGTQRSWYHATFVGDHLESWVRHAAPFWNS